MDTPELLLLELCPQDSIHLDFVLYRLFDAESICEDS